MKIGMPTTLLLEQFGIMLKAAFGEVPYHVGSSLRSKEGDWRDVDVRVMLPDAVYAQMGFGDPEYPHRNARWVAYTLAFSELGRKMTGLPIDFQIQQVSYANARMTAATGNPRSALGIQYDKEFETEADVCEWKIYSDGFTIIGCSKQESLRRVKLEWAYCHDCGKRIREVHIGDVKEKEDVQ